MGRGREGVGHSPAPPSARRTRVVAKKVAFLFAKSFQLAHTDRAIAGRGCMASSIPP